MSDSIYKPVRSRPPRLALIGCGAIAELYHLPALARHPAVLEQLVLVDRNASRLNTVAAKFNVRQRVQDYHEILAQVDGVILAVPHHLHYPIALDFLRQGVPVLCEKPLAESTSEAREMVTTAQQYGVKLAVNHTRRLFPAYIRIKALLDEGALGTLQSIEYIDGEAFTWPTASGFYFNAGTPRGVLLDRGVHGLDTICWWLGAKPRVIASRNDAFGGCEGTAVVALQHAACAIELKLSWLSRLQNRFTIVGDLGSITGGIEEWDRVTVRYHTGKTVTTKLKVPERSYHEFGEKMLDNFLAVIQEDAPPCVPAHAVLPTLELIEECYQTATRFTMPWLETDTANPFREGQQEDSRKELYGSKT